jgi:hypothetical protein
MNGQRFITKLMQATGAKSQADLHELAGMRASDAHEVFHGFRKFMYDHTVWDISQKTGIKTEALMGWLYDR